MVEIFEAIMQYPLQFLAGLGISSGTIYGVCSFVKWIVSCINKKSKNAKEILNQQAIADTLIKAIGGVDNFMDSIANKVIEKITTNQTINDLKILLQQIANKDDCPIELKAYIETILSQSGSEQLGLLYEQTKATLIDMAKDKTRSLIDNGNAAIEQEKKQNELEVDATEPAQPVAEKEESTTQTVVRDDDIDYA